MKVHLLPDTDCTELLIPSGMLLALALGVEVFQTLVGEKDLIEICIELSSIIDINNTHVVVMGVSLMQGIVHVVEIGG